MTTYKSDDSQLVSMSTPPEKQNLVTPGTPVMIPDGGTSSGKQTRFTKRSQLFWRRRVANDVAFAFAVIGFVLMVFEAEMTIHDVYKKDEKPSLIIKSFISLSTVMLVCFVLLYHKLNIQLYMFLHSIQVRAEFKSCGPK